MACDLYISEGLDLARNKIIIHPCLFIKLHFIPRVNNI